MKKIIMIICAAVSWAGISHAQDAPYKANYSSKFTIADESYANKVLSLWKDYENNTLDKHVDWFADSVSMTVATGQTTKGKAANLAGAKAYRATLKDLKVSVDAWVSLKSDRGDNAVCIWGTEDFTDQNGKHVVQDLQEVWMFNKDGKIDMMLQYLRPGGTM
jgi:SnoaL-like protein